MRSSTLSSESSAIPGGHATSPELPPRRTRFCPRGRVNPPPETDRDLASGRDPPPEKPTLPQAETDEFRQDTSPI